MINYIYDGSFDGLMTAIYEAYYRRQDPDNILPEHNYQQDFWSQWITIKTDLIKSEKVQKAVEEKISRYAMKTCLYVYLSEIKGSSTLIYKYLRWGFKLGHNLDKYLSNDVVLNMHKIRQKVGREAHNMKGLLRFRKLKYGVYYAPISPDYNIIGLMADHFVRRFADQNFIIHDVKRNLSVVYNKKEWILTDTPLKQQILVESQDEQEFQNLWKQYFESITISERYNPRLQSQNMPKKYWKYLIEK